MSKTGKDAFIAHYTQLLGSVEAFENFTRRLALQTKPALFFAERNRTQLQHMWSEANIPWEEFEECANALRWPSELELGTTLPGYEEHLIYPMNPSSLLPPLALDAQPGERVLDACAAPGGKTLVLANAMQATGELTANDMSRARSARLQRVLMEHGEEWVRITTGEAATLFRREEQPFDRILLDAPCSSEKHVWNSPKHLKNWSTRRIKDLSMRQFALLSGLWRILKTDGTLIYSTCAVTPEENERVVEQFLNRYGDEMELEFMRRIEPDAIYDPMFVAQMRRKVS